MKIAILYDHDPKKEEIWGTPYGIKTELQNRGHDLKHYELPAYDKTYGFKNLLEDIKTQEFEPDLLLLMNAGSLREGEPYWNREYFGKYLLVQEAGDEPQAYDSHMKMTEQSDLVFTPDIRCHFAYQNRKINSMWLTHWADTLIYYADDTPKKLACSTSGGSRGNGLTEYLHDNLGKLFINTNGLINKQNGDIYRENAIAFQFARHGEITRRIFEAGACNAMVITNALDAYTGIYDIFEDGVDMVYYNSFDECLDKIKYYLTHDEERKKIASNANRKIMKFHTLSNRVDALMDKIEKMI